MTLMDPWNIVCVVFFKLFIYNMLHYKVILHVLVFMLLTTSSIWMLFNNITQVSPTLFNIYLDEIITKWQKQDITGIKL